jgi:hypothetical protein
MAASEALDFVAKLWTSRLLKIRVFNGAFSINGLISGK